MVSVPSFLLRQLYVEGNLNDATGGFEFQLNNDLGSGYAHKMSPLIVDGVEVPTGSTFFYLDGQEVAFSKISNENAFALEMNKTITVWVDRLPLEPGTHKVEMGFGVPGMGTLRFDFTDVVEDD